MTVAYPKDPIVLIQSHTRRFLTQRHISRLQSHAKRTFEEVFAECQEEAKNVLGQKWNAETDDEVVVWRQLKSGGVLDVPEFESRSRPFLAVSDSTVSPVGISDAYCIVSPRASQMDFDAALDENSVGDQREQLKQSERDLELEISWLHQAIHDRQEVCPEFQKLCIKGEVQRNKACYTYNFIDAAMQFLLRCQTISSSESHQTHS